MLPELPQQNKKKEADAGVKLRHHLDKNPYMTSTFEMKYAHVNNSLPFSEVRQEQITYANAIRSDKGILIRITGVEDAPDYVYLRDEPSYIVVKFKGCFAFIPPDVWQLESKRSKRRSLTESRAKAISNLIILL
jgi:hypothetical protein